MRHLLYLVIFIQTSLFAQQTPAPEQAQAIAIQGGTIHIGNGEVIENGLILIEKGKIKEVSTSNKATNLQNHKIINADGKEIYPGFIAPNTTLGLAEIGAVGATNDNRELGYINPSIRSIIAYNTDSKVTPTVRSNGILLAQIKPVGGRISGQSSIVELDAWNWEDAVYKTDEGIWMNWPSLFSWTGWSTGNPHRKKDEKYSDKIQEIEDYLNLAQAYAKNTNPETVNLKHEAMRGVFGGTKKLYLQTNLAKSIMEAVLLCKKFNITPVIVGGADAWRITDFLVENKVPIILEPTQSLPEREDDDIDQPFKTPKILAEAGIPFAFGVQGYWLQRSLPLQAGQAVGFGLDYEAAIAALTLTTAQILGVDETLGSIEVGKDATIIISEGDVLDMRTCKISDAFIRGKKIDLDNKQTALYRKFSEKYKND